MLGLIPVMTLQQHGCVMILAPTRHVTNVRPSRNSPHQAVCLRQTPEYQYLRFQIYRASNLYCMAIAAEPLLPSGPPSVADWVAISVAVASETRVTAATLVASAAIAAAITNNDVATTATDNEENDNNNVRIHPPPQPTAAVGGNTVKVAETTLRQVSVSSVISNTTKISLRAYFEGSDWPLNEALPKGAEFLRGPFGE
jgi:hypothetical protein